MHSSIKMSKMKEMVALKTGGFQKQADTGPHSGANAEKAVFLLLKSLCSAIINYLSG